MLIGMCVATVIMARDFGNDHLPTHNGYLNTGHLGATYEGSWSIVQIPTTDVLSGCVQRQNSFGWEGLADSNDVVVAFWGISSYMDRHFGAHRHREFLNESLVN